MSTNCLSRSRSQSPVRRHRSPSPRQSSPRNSPEIFISCCKCGATDCDFFRDNLNNNNPPPYCLECWNAHGKGTSTEKECHKCRANDCELFPELNSLNNNPYYFCSKCLEERRGERSNSPAVEDVMPVASYLEEDEKLDWGTKSTGFPPVKSIFPGLMPLAVKSVPSNRQERKEVVEGMQVEGEMTVFVRTNLQSDDDAHELTIRVGTRVSKLCQMVIGKLGIRILDEIRSVSVSGQSLNNMNKLSQDYHEKMFVFEIRSDTQREGPTGVYQQSHFSYASQLAYTVAVNGRPLAPEFNELVIPRDDYIGQLRATLDSSKKSNAYYLLGHFGIGKTNILHGLCQRLRRDKLWSVVEVDFEPVTKNNPWSEILTQGFLRNDYLASYFARSEVTEWKAMRQLFLQKPFTEKTLLICIDEVQVCYRNAEFLSFVSMMVRQAQIRCFFVCATPDFRLVSDVYALYDDSISDQQVVLSPFSSELFCPPYFRMEEIADALSKLFIGLDPLNPRFDVNEFDFVEMAKNVMQKTSGHPYFVMDFFFSPLNHYLKEAFREQYSSTLILTYWENTICSFSLYKLVNFSASRVCKRIFSARLVVDKNPQFLEIYYAVYNNRRIFYDPTNSVHNVMLTCGYVKLTPLDNTANDTMDVIPTSGGSSVISSNSHTSRLDTSIGWILSPVCTLVQLVHSAFDRRNLTRSLASFIVDHGKSDFLAMADLIRYLMSYTNLSAIGKKEGWVSSQRGGVLPSEKQYQIQWWSILHEMAENCPGFEVGYESRAGTGRVDLTVYRSIHGKIWKYQIELCANLQHSHATSANDSVLERDEEVSGFTVESHYVRQLDNYHDKETKQSAVVVIQNKSGAHKYIPQKKLNDVDLFLFSHYVDADNRLSNAAEFEKFNFETNLYQNLEPIVFNIGSTSPDCTNNKRSASSELPPMAATKKAKVDRCCSNCHQPGHNIRTCPVLKK